MVKPIEDKGPSISDLTQDDLKEAGSFAEAEQRNLRSTLRIYFEQKPDRQDEWIDVVGEHMLDVVQRGRTDLFNIFLEFDVPINFQSDETGFSVLHMAAACGARNVLRILIKREESDYLLRDKQGRLPSELAYLGGPVPDVAVSRLLGIKEVKQADLLGIKLTRRPK
ncbi:ankyrin repeat domain-containing protein [Vibrio diabolicus]|uniref:ankyrin repeat domain-containing protein n=1 Tax=Vibrio diabolicus TaxID=50719 RepID=UPI00215E05A2|nr:ankyrin repeat domain-containing protein [Vibrio diabolicus]MCS0397888.1 ankyrin repeat domain-containing protein [Vibrio diabolicus]